jgi:hypothetical protein
VGVGKRNSLTLIGPKILVLEILVMALPKIIPQKIVSELTYFELKKKRRKHCGR